MKKLTTLTLMVLICGVVWGQWNVSNDGILYKRHDRNQIILKTTRTDNTQEGSLSTDGWGNFIFSKSLSINSNLYLGQGQLKGELTLRSGNYQRVVSLTANNSYTLNSKTFGLRINPNQIIDMKGHFITDVSKIFVLLSASRSDGTSYNELLQHRVYEGTNKHDLNFTNNGRVGIGTISPSAKLDVAGTIKAHEIAVTLASIDDMQLNGTLAANNITYTANGNTADFVFEDNYQLKDLAEVEAFIKTNKHLPEIPSAADMEEAGVNLAEMNKLLLMKVEELTLYSIQLEKEVKEVRSTESEVRREMEKMTEDRRRETEEMKDELNKQKEYLAKMESLLEELIKQ